MDTINLNLINVVVLFLDDDEALKEVMEINFKEHGFINYKWFLKDYELFNNLTDETQVCVIDQRLKGSDTTGIEVIKKIKEINSICHCVLMSSQEDIDVVIDAYDNGCDKYIRKSRFDFVEILMDHMEKAIAEVNERFASSIRLFARMNESLELFEQLKKKHIEVISANNN